MTFRSDPYVRWVEIPLAFVGVAGLAAVVDVVVLRALYAGTGFASTAALVEAKVVALLAAGAVRLVGYRLGAAGEMTSARRVRWARPEPPGDVRLSVVVPAYDEADRIGATVRRLRDGLAEVAARRGWRWWWSTTARPTPPPTPPWPPGRTRWWCSRRTGARARRCGPGCWRPGAGPWRSPTPTWPTAPTRSCGCWRRWRTAGTWPSATAATPTPARWCRRSRLRRWGSRAINWLGYAVLLGSYRDTQSGLKAFRSDVARFVFARCRVDGFAFDVEVLHLVERHQLSWSRCRSR